MEREGGRFPTISCGRAPRPRAFLTKKTINRLALFISRLFFYERVETTCTVFLTCNAYDLPLKQAIPSQSASVELSEAESETSSKVVSYPTLQCVYSVGVSVAPLSVRHSRLNSSQYRSSCCRMLCTEELCRTRATLAHNTPYCCVPTFHRAFRSGTRTSRNCADYNEQGRTVGRRSLRD